MINRYERTQATAVVRQVLGQLGKEEDETKADDLRSLGDVIRCITCEGNIVLSYDLMVSQECTDLPPTTDADFD
jgi:hypothetical protein